MTVCKQYSKICIPGAFTPTEILAAWEAGADAVKVFPATKLGPEFFKDMSGPFPQIRLTPTGGIGLDNIGAYIKAGACFAGAGTSLTDRRMVEAQSGTSFPNRRQVHRRGEESKGMTCPHA